MDASALTLPLQHTFAHRKRGDRIKERTLGRRLLATKSWEGREEKLTKSTALPHLCGTNEEPLAIVDISPLH